MLIMTVLTFRDVSKFANVNQLINADLGGGGVSVEGIFISHGSYENCSNGKQYDENLKC